MRATRSFFWTILFLFLYQNCGQTEETLGARPSTDSSTVEASSMGPVDLTRPITFQLERRNVELDLATGEILNSEDPSWAAYCLSEIKRQKIQTLLESNGICQETHSYPEDLYCTMSYTFPYMEVFLDGGEDRIKLGEANSGCPEQTTFLCEEDSLLDPLLRTLKFSVDFSVCR